MKYEVEILRTSYSSKVFEVEADSKAEAIINRLKKVFGIAKYFLKSDIFCLSLY